MFVFEMCLKYRNRPCDFVEQKNQLRLTHRRADPHVGVEVLAVDDPAPALVLLVAELLHVAAVVLGEGVEGAVLLARGVAVHVHFVLHVALQQPRHFGIRRWKL